jgi:hypothetical protein
VSIDKAYLNVLVVISKLLGQSILGMRQLPRMNILVLKKIGCVIKINNTGKGQYRGLKTKMIENQEITTLQRLNILRLTLYIHCNI